MILSAVARFVAMISSWEGQMLDRCFSAWAFVAEWTHTRGVIHRIGTRRVRQASTFGTSPKDRYRASRQLMDSSISLELPAYPYLRSVVDLPRLPGTMMP